MNGYRFNIAASFPNPIIPIDPQPGFSDAMTATRPVGWGFTDDQKPWVYSTTGTSVLTSSKNGTQGIAHVDTGLGLLGVDALARNGVFSFSQPVAGTRQGGGFFRWQDDLNYMRIGLRTTSGDNRYIIQKVVNGTTTTFYQSAALSADGDVIKVTLAGDRVSISKVNAGVTTEIMAERTITDPTLLTGKRYGAYLSQNTTGRYGAMSFVAAA